MMIPLVDLTMSGLLDVRINSVRENISLSRCLQVRALKEVSCVFKHGRKLRRLLTQEQRTP